jgi:tRNA-binding protein
MLIPTFGVQLIYRMEQSEQEKLNWSEFMKVEMRVGTIISAEKFKEVRNPAYKMIVDFGPFGTRKTSAQITKLYTPEELVGKQVIAVLNFPPKQIATIMSECLVMGCVGDENEVTLIQPERKVANGTRIG